MSSAKVVIKTQDRSAIVPTLNGVYAGIVITCDKGPVNKPFLITSTNQLLDIFGNPNPKLGVSHYSALNYLSQGNKLWVVRAAHNDAKYSAALVRSKIEDIPTSKTAVLSADSLVVKPLKDGLTQEQLDSYSFPVYMTNKEYEQLDNTVFEDSANSYEVRLNKHDNLAVNDSLSFTSTKTLELLNDPTTSDGEDEITYTVQKLEVRSLEYDNIILATPLTVTKGTVVKKVGTDGTTLTNYAGNPTVVRSATNSTNILVSNADYIANGDTIDIGGVRSVFNEKVLYTEEAKIVTLDKRATILKTQNVFRVTQSEFEDRDAFLVTAYNQGAWGNGLSIGITPSKNYANAFNILVYFKGVQVESWEVTRTQELDGFGKQMYLEQKINGKSAYIQVHDNLSDVDGEGNPEKPLNTDYSLWRANSEDVFGATALKLAENVLKGHVEVKLSDVTGLALGSRVKFVVEDDINGNIVLSKEYKVQELDSVAKTITLDRNLEEDQISMKWTNNSGTLVDNVVYLFDPTLNNPTLGIVDGVQYYAIDKLPNVYYNYKLNASFTISGVLGTLLSAGANMPTGGSIGSTVTVGDLINGLNLLKNKEHTPINLLMDGGFALPAYAQAIEAVCQAQGLTHGYLSDDPASEDGVNYLEDIVAYKNSTQLNTSTSSMFAGWIKIYDSYNQLEVWASPEGFAAAAQTMTTRDYNMFTPAAGWLRGKITGGLDVKRKFSEGDRDYLVDNRINPIRSKEGSGLVIWGNETLLVQPSPMQLRSVAMLLIVIKTGLEAMLENKTFDLNNERTWGVVEGALNAFMRDEIKGKDGVYNYSIAVQDVVTDGDIDNRRMPVFLGIQPTMDIQEIPVTLAIYNKSVDIAVSL